MESRPPPNPTPPPDSYHPLSSPYFPPPSPLLSPPKTKQVMWCGTRPGALPPTLLICPPPHSHSMALTHTASHNTTPPVMPRCAQVRIGHDNAGRDKRWHLDRIIITDRTSNTHPVVFPCGGYCMTPPSMVLPAVGVYISISVYLIIHGC